MLHAARIEVPFGLSAKTKVVRVLFHAARMEVPLLSKTKVQPGQRQKTCDEHWRKTQEKGSKEQQHEPGMITGQIFK